MGFTHKVFLFWLLYLVTIIFGWGLLLYLGLPQIALGYDHSYLTYVLAGLYLIAEVISGRQAWSISEENRIADEAIKWFSNNKLEKTTLNGDGSVSLHAEPPFENALVYDHVIPKSAMAEHFSLLCVKANAGQRKIRQSTIIDVTAERLYERTMVAEFISSRIVWIGILATILGVIMAFWPMIGGASIETMKDNLGVFFGGVAVAFLPTAVSFVFKIVLDFNCRIISDGVRSLIDKIACVSETELLPVLDHEEI